MKLIIDIPEKVVTAIQNGEDYRYDIHTAIAQGTPYEERPVWVHTHVHCPKCNTINEYPEFNKTCKYCGAELKEAKDNV